MSPATRTLSVSIVAGFVCTAAHAQAATAHPDGEVGFQDLIASTTASTAATFLMTSGTERDVQIRSIDFENGIIELFNFSNIDYDLSGWRFCSHDFDQARRYTATAGLNGVTIESGSSLFIHFDNDAPANDSDRVDRSSLGGAFALPLDQDAYGIQLYAPIGGPVNFGNSSQITDHLQWNINGQSVGSAEVRTGQAVSQNLWSAGGDFIVTTAEAQLIMLADLSGDILGSPSEYVAIEPQPICNNPSDVDGSGELDAFDVIQFLETLELGCEQE
ncbi:MAG: hypothetical protein AAGB34_09975 [Planctomycetota bacterium]